MCLSNVLVVAESTLSRDLHLTLKAEDSLICFYYYFSQKIRLGILCESSANSHERSSSFLWKIHTQKWIKISSSSVVLSTLRVKFTYTSSMLGWKILFMKPIEGDLNGYFSGRSTLTFHTPPSYGAEKEKIKSNTLHVCTSLIPLTVTTLLANSAEGKLMFFPENRNWHFMQTVSTICIKFQILFSGKKIRKIWKSVCWKFYPEC